MILQSENGVIGVGPLAAPDKADTDLVDAGSRRITLRPGASIVDSSWSFAMIRGGHIDVTILGAFEVAANGDLANWDMRVPNRGPLVGGAMDLAACAREVRVIMEHVTRKGAPRLLEKCALPLTAVRCVSRVYTDLAVVDVTPQGFVVREMVEDQPRGIAGEDRRAADVCAGLQAAHRAAAAGSRCRSDAHELHRGERRFAALRGGRQRQAAGADPRDGRHDGKLGPGGAALSAKRRVVRYDTRGAGFSEKIRGPLTIDTMTDDLIALLDGLGIREKVALAGTAVGGAIALHTAFRFPERVAAAIVTSPATSIPPANREAVLDARRANSSAKACASSSRRPPPTAIRRNCAATGRASRASARAGSPTIPSSFAAIYRMLAGMDLSPRACRDQMPGAGDRRRVRPRPPASRVEPIAQAIPGAQFKVLPTGHYAGLQAPELMAREIAAFLDSVGL